MSSIINNLQNINLNTKSSFEIDFQFVQTFNNTFSFDNNNIKVIGTLAQLGVGGLAPPKNIPYLFRYKPLIGYFK